MMETSILNWYQENKSRYYTYAKRVVNGAQIKEDAVLIKLTDKEVGRCRQFAKKQLGTSQGTYAKRGQFFKGVIERQITEGKIAEIAAYKFLRKKKFDVSEPDFNIYKGRQKSYAADLTDNTLNWHCKTQSKASAETHGTSWLFQKTDPIVTDPQPNDFLILTTVAGNLVEVAGIIAAVTIKEEKLYRKPNLERLQGTKTCIYLTDIESFFLTY
jgi:hypothetical protein